MSKRSLAITLFILAGISYIWGLTNDYKYYPYIFMLIGFILSMIGAIIYPTEKDEKPEIVEEEDENE